MLHLAQVLVRSSARTFIDRAAKTPCRIGVEDALPLMREIAALKATKEDVWASLIYY